MMSPGDTTHDFVATLWKVQVQQTVQQHPTALAADGTLWYIPIVDEADIMVHNGTTWVGYLDSTSPIMRQVLATQTDPNGPNCKCYRIRGYKRPNDKTALKNGDIWINTANLDKYPRNLQMEQC